MADTCFPGFWRYELTLLSASAYLCGHPKETAFILGSLGPVQMAIDYSMFVCGEACMFLLLVLCICRSVGHNQTPY